MKNRSRLLAALCLPPFAFACSSSTSSGTTSGCTSKPVTVASQPVVCGATTIVASEANDYQFSSTITLPPVTVKSMTNLKFEWGSVTHDFLGHSLNAVTDLNMVSAMIFQLPLSEVQKKLNDDTLKQGDLLTSVPASWPPPGMTTNGATTAMLYDFQINGTMITPDMYNGYFDPVMYPPSAYSYMFAASTGTELGKGYRMLQSFNIDPGSSATTVTLKDDSTKLTCDVSLRNLTIAGVTAGTPNLTVDFTDMVTNMKHNALGGTFMDGYITSAVIGHYTQTPAELEEKFLDLDMIPTAYYSVEVPGGTMADLSMAKETKTNAAFTGIDDTGTWLIGLICGNCRNPAPWYMTIAKPCTGT
jgi:hypothetical protein